MLSAVLNGKKRGTGLAGKSLNLGDSEGAEDVLTATVFERLAYLPESVLQTFFDELLNQDEPIGSLDDMIFWPSYEWKGQRVEPDVVLFGSSRTLIVEAKRHDHSLQQYAKQLARELLAATSDESDVRQPVLLTIGGMKEYSEATRAALSEEIDAEISGAVPYDLVCRSWHQVYLALQKAISTADSDHEAGLQRLRNDIAMTYEWHGLRTQGHRWLDQLSPVLIDTLELPLRHTPHPPKNSFVHTRSLHKPLSQISTVDISNDHFPFMTWSVSA